MPSANTDATPPSLAPSKPFSLSLSSKQPSTKFALKPSKPTPQPKSLPQGGKKRPYSALADPDSEPEDDATNGRHEAVLGFGLDGKAISAADTGGGEDRLLVIKPEKSGRDWREETRRRRGKKNLLPAEAQARQQNGNGQVGDGGAVERVEVSIVGGLKVAERRVDGDGDTAMSDGKVEVEEAAETKELTADEEAVAALLGEKKKSILVIPAAGRETAEGNGGEDDEEFANEADRYRADVDSRPLPASLADYDSCPVDGFGAALLRGLGWKDGEAVGKGAKTAAVPREVKRRPALLGLGARETPGGVAADELGAWNHKKGRGKEKVAYNPVMMKNSKTGEMVTEEEFELRKLEAKQGKKNKEVDWRERRDGKLSIDNERQKERLAIQNGDERAESGSSKRDRSKDRERHRERDNDTRRDRDYGSSRRERSRSRERSKDKSSRRERDRSKGRERERRRKDDDYDRRHRESGSKRDDKDRDYDRHSRTKDYDKRGHDRKQKRH